ncbi:protein kinase [Streptomyces sp. NPDC006197]|uniref:protein kinase domain-containing protein n=1 Tax=Streptomyces sp. NPDC006197 TaxID=3156685 RepID=UPI0033BF7CA3
MNSFGHVHFVRHEDGTQGVLKSPRPGNGGKINKTTQQRFQEEVRRMQQLTQDQVAGIVPVLDADPQDPPQWFVMPKAKNLRDVLSPGGRPAELREVVEAIRHVAGTLAELAVRDISHRDIKPDNLLHYQGRPAVADFGIAGLMTLSENGCGGYFVTVSSKHPPCLTMSVHQHGVRGGRTVLGPGVAGRSGAGHRRGGRRWGRGVD